MRKGGFSRSYEMGKRPRQIENGEISIAIRCLARISPPDLEIS